MSSIAAKISPPGMESAVFGEFRRCLKWLGVTLDKQRFNFTKSNLVNHIIATFFFFLAFTSGVSMFCNISTTMLGAGIITWSGMTTIGENCDFRAFPYLITTFQICLPLAIGIPAIFMLPNVLQTETIINWEKEKWCEDAAPDLAKFVEKEEEQQQQEATEKNPII